MKTAVSSSVLKMVMLFNEDKLFDWHKRGDGSYYAVCCQMQRDDHNEDERFLAIRCDPESFSVNWCGKHMLFADERMHEYLQSTPTYEGPTYALCVMDCFSLWFYPVGEQLPSSSEAVIGGA